MLRRDKVQGIDKTCRLNVSESNFLVKQCAVFISTEIPASPDSSSLQPLTRPHTRHHGCLHHVASSCTIAFRHVKGPPEDFLEFFGWIDSLHTLQKINKPRSNRMGLRVSCPKFDECREAGLTSRGPPALLCWSPALRRSPNRRFRVMPPLLCFNGVQP
jgi:hypothetical protein